MAAKNTPAIGKPSARMRKDVFARTQDSIKKHVDRIRKSNSARRKLIQAPTSKKVKMEPPKEEGTKTDVGENAGGTFVKRKGLKVPKVKNRTLRWLLGMVNLFFFGWGTIVAGISNGSLADILVGLLQFVIPFTGWLWSIVWGVLMIAEKD